MIKLIKISAILVLTSLASVLTVSSIRAVELKVEAMKILIEGQDINRAASTPLGLERTLDEFDDKPRPTGFTHKQWIDIIHPPGAGAWTGTAYFLGLGGVAGLPALDIADRTLGASGNHGNRKPGAIIYGKIDNFAWDAAAGSGNMEVIQIYSTALGRSGSAHSWAYKYFITVHPGGFHVDTKDLSDPSNVFPVAAWITGIKISAETAEGFNYKLYASGKAIVVTAIEWAPNYNSAGPTMWNPAPARRVWTAIMTPDASSCLDMMFRDFPPASLPAGARPPFYCLGRCAKPRLINTR